MKKRQIFLAVVFGALLAITGCGDDETGGGNTGTGGSGTGGADGTGGSGTGGSGTGGSNGSGFCATLCNACAMEQAAACTSECESQLGELGGQVDLERCPTELDALGTCLGANDCNGDACQSQYTDWFTCLVGFAF